MLAVEEAHARITAAFAPLPSEWVHLAAAAGRVLAEDLIAARDQPPGDTSAMDGYAVRAADLASGRATLRLVGSAPAGRAFERPLGPGETVRIFTGGLLPEGADAVAIQENATARASGWGSRGRSRPAPTCVRPGSISGAASARLLAGRRLSARDIGFAAALNHAWLPVRRRPRVALVATGDELVLPGQPLDRRRSSTPTAWRWPPWSASGAARRSIWGSSATAPKASPTVTPQLRGVDLVVTIGRGLGRRA